MHTGPWGHSESLRLVLARDAGLGNSAIADSVLFGFAVPSIPARYRSAAQIAARWQTLAKQPAVTRLQSDKLYSTVLLYLTRSRSRRTTPIESHQKARQVTSSLRSSLRSQRWSLNNDHELTCTGSALTLCKHQRLPCAEL
jgi:hypothetical protein